MHGLALNQDADSDGGIVFALLEERLDGEGELVGSGDFCDGDVGRFDRVG
jgi:hypothetical protein